MRKLMMAAAVAVAFCGFGTSASAETPVLPLPAGTSSVQIIKPDASVPAQYARFVGVWAALLEYEFKLRHYTLVIHGVSAEGIASVVLLGDNPHLWRVDFSGKIEGNTIRWTNPSTGSQFAITLNDDGSVSLTRFTSKGLQPEHSVLAKMPETAYPEGVSVAKSVAEKTSDLDYFLHYKAPDDK